MTAIAPGVYQDSDGVLHLYPREAAECAGFPDGSYEEEEIAEGMVLALRTVGLIGPDTPVTNVWHQPPAAPH